MKNKITGEKTIAVIGTFLILIILNSVPATLAAETFEGGDTGGFGGGYQVVGSVSNPQFNQPSFGVGSGFNVRDYWSDFNKEDCNERQDLLLMIPPGGCSPSVVRSDLLEEQNVPVFCKVSSIELNPLVDITKIKSIRFRGEYPKGVQSVSYFPARAAIRSTNKLEASPVVDNIGYLVVVLKGGRGIVERDMPNFLEGNVTAVIDYDTDGDFGVGSQDFFLNEVKDEDWLRDYRESGFWDGKGYIRVTEIEENSAVVSVYQNPNQIMASIKLDDGETSNTINLGGYYCSAGMKLKLQDVDYPQDTALIKVDDQEFWVGKGSRFLDGKCRVLSLNPGEVGGGSLRIKCSGASSFTLLLNPAKADLEITEIGKEMRNITVRPGDSVITKTVEVKSSVLGKIGEFWESLKVNSKDIVPVREERTVSVSYIGKVPGAKSNYLILTASPIGTSEFEDMGAFIHNKQKYYFKYGHSVEKLKTTLSLIAGSVVGIVVSGGTSLIGQIAIYAGAGAVSKAFQELSDKEKDFYSYITGELVGEYEFGDDDVKILLTNEGLNSWEEYGIKYVDAPSGEVVLEGNTLLKQYYENAIDSYNDLSVFYPNEKDLSDEEAWAAKGLINAGNLAGKIGLEKEQRAFYDRVIDNYPGTKTTDTAENKLNTIGTGFSRDSQALVNMNDDSHFMSLINVREPGVEDLGAEIEFYVSNDAVKRRLMEMDFETVIPGTKIPFKITNINEEYIDVKVAPQYGIWKSIGNELVQTFVDTELRWETKRLKLGEKINLVRKEDLTIQGVKIASEKISQVSVRVTKINLNKQAQIKIIPEVRGTRTEADFGFKIGIEKRAVQLSPEKTKEIMTNLQEQIKKWSDINKKLGELVRGLKAACFATSAILTVKNFFGGLSGESQARKEVMTGENGWNERCRKDALAQSISVEECLTNNNNEINKAVEARTKELEERNKELDSIHKNLPPSARTSDGFFTESYDTKAVTEEYRKTFDSFCNENLENDVNVGIKGEDKEVGALSLACSNSEKLDVTDMRDIMTDYNLAKSSLDNSVLNDFSKSRLSDTLYDVDLNARNKVVVDGLVEAGKGTGVTAIATSLGNRKDILQRMDKVDGLSSGATHAFLLNPGSEGSENIKDKNIQVELKLVGGEYKVAKAHILDTEKTDVTQAVTDLYSSKRIVKADASLYKNIYREKGVVKYYERAPYKGLPALVPFDSKKGWYAATDYVVSGFGRPYEDSGRAVNFWICNVGENGLFEFKQGDDCRYYNVGTPASTIFPGLSPSESSALVSKAQNALRTASRDYGKKRVTIGSGTYDTAIAGDGTSGRCSDFMSPNECKLLFNLCDPVICPASRCDFGGKYRVDDVIQSGIIGSLALCLPNFPEVYVPVCLTGVHAGIDSYVSILNSTEACLNESLKTGRNVGICDEIKSIYMCEFFWKQAVPLLDVGIPRLFEIAQGQGVRGGGEYTTVQSAWDNAQSSVNFFTQEYAINSIKAFNIRSTADVGGEVCKSFVGGRFPDSADFFDRLIEPDSPVQYSGWFDENILNTATIPPTSHYKVYYHIYSGKDIGAQYVVYLRGSTSTGLVQSTGDYVVDRGYIARGSQVDEAKDFIAVSGFTKLCISVNGKENCDFKQVSTSAAINYINDKYAAEQAAEGEIETSRACVAGQQSLLSFAQPNLQAGAEQYIQPELQKRGIVRVCSTNNPGKSVDKNTGEFDPTKLKTDRWKPVGYCDDKTIRCWVDQDSVKDVLAQNKLLLNDTLSKIDKNYLEGVEIIHPGNAKDVLDRAKVVRDGIKGGEESYAEKVATILLELEGVVERGPNNNYKAKAIFLKAEIYRKLTERVYEEHLEMIEASAKRLKNQPKETVETIEGGETSIITQKIFEYTNPLGIKFYFKFEKGKWLFSPNLENDEWEEVTESYLEGIGLKDFSLGSFEEGGKVLLREGAKVIVDKKTTETTPEFQRPWTIESALKFFELAEPSGIVSGDLKKDANYIFVTELKEDKVITQEEYEDIMDGGWIFYSSMNDVKRLLEKKLKKGQVELRLAEEKKTESVVGDPKEDEEINLEKLKGPVTIAPLRDVPETIYANGVATAYYISSNEIWLNRQSESDVRVGVYEDNTLKFDLKVVEFTRGADLEFVQTLLHNKQISFPECGMDELKEGLDQLKYKNGPYSSHKDIIDDIYKKGCLTRDEYIEINGEGFWNVEQDMVYVRKLLNNKLDIFKEEEGVFNFDGTISIDEEDRCKIDLIDGDSFGILNGKLEWYHPTERVWKTAENNMDTDDWKRGLKNYLIKACALYRWQLNQDLSVDPQSE